MLPAERHHRTVRLLSAAGAGLGVGVAWLGLDALVAFIGRFTSRASEIALDGGVLVFTMAIATLAALLFAWIPRVPVPGSTRSTTLAGRRATAGIARQRVQGGLVVAQIAVSFVLLVGGGLFGRTFLAIQSVDPGFETDNVLTMEIPTFLDGRSQDESRTYYETILERVRAVPGVGEAALGTTVPLSAAGRVFEAKRPGARVAGPGRDPALDPSQPIWLAIVVWWAFFSRARGSERWGAVVLMIVALVTTALLNHESMGLLSLWIVAYAIPVLSLAFVVWAVASRRVAERPRRAAMVAFRLSLDRM